MRSSLSLRLSSAATRCPCARSRRLRSCCMILVLPYLPISEAMLDRCIMYARLLTRPDASWSSRRFDVCHVRSSLFSVLVVVLQASSYDDYTHMYDLAETWLPFSLSLLLHRSHTHFPAFIHFHLPSISTPSSIRFRAIYTRTKLALSDILPSCVLLKLFASSAG